MQTPRIPPTALMPEIAAVDGHEATVRILVEMGADPLSRVCDYHYKLLPAAKAGHLSAAPVILDHELAAVSTLLPETPVLATT